MTTHDIAILGGGPAGCRAAESATSAGLSVLLFERKVWGGTTSEEGASLWPHLLGEWETFAQARQAGLLPDGARFPYAEAIGRARALSLRRSGFVHSSLRQRGVTLVPAEAVLDGQRGRFFKVSSSAGQFESKRVLLATGSMAAFPGLPDLKTLRHSGFVHTPGTLAQLETLPVSLVVAGSGLRGLQIAAFYAALGVHVTVLERKRTIAPEFDSDVVEWVIKYMKTLGVEFFTSAEIISLTQGHMRVALPEGQRAFQMSHIVFGDKRWPAIRGIGLDSIHVLTHYGSVVADLSGRSSVPDVYVAGDASGQGGTVAEAYFQSENALASILAKRPPSTHRPSISAPIAGGLASVGESSFAAVKAGRRIAQVKLAVPLVGVSHPDLTGLCKLIADRHTGHLIGAHLLGQDAALACGDLGLCIESGMGLDAIQRHLPHRGDITYYVREALCRLSRLLN